MKITIDNYEAYLLDYIEGNVAPATEQELRSFLASHPELHTEMENFNPVIVTPEKITFPHKQSLKKFEFHQNITENNFENFCIAYHEKILTEEKTKISSIIHLPYLRIASTAAGILFFVTVSMYVLKKNKSTVKQRFNTEIAHIYLPHRMTKHPLTIVAKKNDIIPHITVPTKNKTHKLEVMGITDTTRRTITEKEQIALLNPLGIGNIKSTITKRLKISEKDYGISETIPIQNKNFFSKVVKTWQNLKNQPLNLEKLKIKRTKLSFIAVCKAGIEGINSFTDANIILTERKDSLGNITTLYFESDLIKSYSKKGN